jgi:chorismate-pyruvate lyase
MPDGDALLIQRFHAALLASDSATALLEGWCGEPVSALRVAVPAMALPAEHVPLLALQTGERVVHRRVKLVAGGRVLCGAENWYVAERLTAAMNWALERTTMAFGHVVAPLRPKRRALATTLPPEDASGVVLEHRTLLTAGDGRAISIVHEGFTREILVASPSAYTALR